MLLARESSKSHKTDLLVVAFPLSNYNTLYNYIFSSHEQFFIFSPNIFSATKTYGMHSKAYLFMHMTFISQG